MNQSRFRTTQFRPFPFTEIQAMTRRLTRLLDLLAPITVVSLALYVSLATLGLGLVA